MPAITARGAYLGKEGELALLVLAQEGRWAGQLSYHPVPDPGPNSTPSKNFRNIYKGWKISMTRGNSRISERSPSEDPVLIE